MTKFQKGWDEAVAITNARIGADPDAPAAPEPASGEHPEVVQVRKRCEKIVSALVEAGMLKHARVYFDDPRDLDEILDEIRATHLATDFASHLGLKPNST